MVNITTILFLFFFRSSCKKSSQQVDGRPARPTKEATSRHCKSKKNQFHPTTFHGKNVTTVRTVTPHLLESGTIVMNRHLGNVTTVQTATLHLQGNDTIATLRPDDDMIAMHHRREGDTTVQTATLRHRDERWKMTTTHPRERDRKKVRREKREENIPQMTFRLRGKEIATTKFGSNKN